MRIVTTTFAKHDSVRIPAKNRKNFCGQPLITWTMNFAERLGYPYYVFTNSPDIKAFAKIYNAMTIHEPEWCLEDACSIIDQYKYVDADIAADIYILLQPTCPVRDLIKYRRWIKDFVNSNADCGFSVIRKDRKNYEMNGGFYIFSADIIHRKSADDIINENAIMFLDDQFVDLDYPEQWEVAEREYKNYFRNVL